MGQPYTPDPAVKHRAIARAKADLRVRLERVNETRKAHATVALALKAAKEEAAKGMAPLVERTKEAEAQMQLAELEVRNLALTIYDADDSTKTILPGLTIAIKRISKYAKDAALAWAKAKGLFLIPEKLDEKAFEAFMQSTPKSAHDFKDFEIEEEPQVRIATDLSLALEAAARLEAAAIIVDTVMDAPPAIEPRDDRMPF